MIRARPRILHLQSSFDRGGKELRAEHIIGGTLALQDRDDIGAARFDRVSRIYTAQGNPTEAERFRSFARRAAAERD